MSELTAVEQAVVAAAERAELLDLTDAAERDVRAEVLRDLLVAGKGLRLAGVRVIGGLDLEGLRIGGAVRLVRCEFTGPVFLRGADLPLLDLRRSRLVSLSVIEATVERVVLLTELRATRGVDLGGARIGAACSLQRAELRNPDGPALVASRLRLAGELLLDGLVAEGADVDGAVRLIGARIDGRLSARGVQLTNRVGPALAADNLQVTDTADFSHGSVLRGHGEPGAVRLVGARAGSLSFGGARLENPAGRALAAHYLDIAGTLYFDRIRSTGGVRVSGSRIGGQLNLSDAVVDGGSQEALAATRLQVAQAVLLDDATLRNAGERATVDLRSARIGGDLELQRTRLSNPTGAALRLNTATVDGRAVLSRLVIEHGGIDLRDSTVGTLYDDPARLPADSWVEVNGLVYRGMPGHPGVTVGDRLAWLHRMPAYAAQPYRQLAAAYKAAGHEDDTRRVLVAQQEHLRRSGALTGWGRLRHRLFGLTLQYGYQPLRAVALLGVTLAAAALLLLAAAGGTTTPAAGGNPGGPCPAVDRVGLAIDTAVPLVSTGAGERCQLATATTSGQWLAAAGWVLTLLGWASATLVVAGYTGLVRRN